MGISRSEEEELFETIIKPVAKGLLEQGFKGVNYDHLSMTFFRNGKEFTLTLKSSGQKNEREVLRGKDAVEAMRKQGK